MRGGRVQQTPEETLGIHQVLAVPAVILSGVMAAAILTQPGAILVRLQDKAGVHPQAIGVTAECAAAASLEAVAVDLVAVVVAMQAEAVVVMEDDKHFFIRLSS